MKGYVSGTSRSGASTALGAKCSSPIAVSSSPLRRHRCRHFGPCHARPSGTVAHLVHDPTSGVSCASQPGRWLDMGVISTVPTSPSSSTCQCRSDSAPLNLSASDASSSISPDNKKDPVAGTEPRGSLAGRQADRSKDWITKTTLVRDYGAICVEDLLVKNMIRSARTTAGRANGSGPSLDSIGRSTLRPARCPVSASPIRPPTPPTRWS